MSQDRMCDVPGSHPQCRHPVHQPALGVAENGPLDIPEAVADPGIDQHRLASPHNQRTGEVQTNAIALVGRMIFLPQLPGHHPKHASAIVVPQAVGKEGNFEGTNLNLRRNLHTFTPANRHWFPAPACAVPLSPILSCRYSPASHTPRSIVAAPPTAAIPNTAAKRPPPTPSPAPASPSACATNSRAAPSDARSIAHL